MEANTTAVVGPWEEQSEAEISPFYTYSQAAAYCNVERTTIYRAVKAGRLRASGPGLAIRFHIDDLNVWMRSRNRK